MKFIKSHFHCCLLAFFIAFVHGDAQLFALTLEDIQSIQPSQSHQNRYEVAFAVPHRSITLEALPYAVVETSRPQKDPSWLSGYERVALGASSRFWRVTCPQDMVFDVFLDDVAQAPQVRYVVPDLIKSVAPMGLAIDDPKYPAQWYLEELGAELLWENSFGEPSVKVAVIDSGIDIAHPDLQSKITAPKDTWDDDDDPSPNAGEFCFGGMSGICDEHGTAVAGIILADANDLNIIGLCPDCSLIPIKMLGEGYLLPTSSSLSGDIAAFEHAIENDAAVINNSWGFSEHLPVPAPLASIIHIAATQNRDGKGAVVVFAAGNEDREIMDDELSALSDVLSISATDRYGNPTPYTNYGASVDLAAPAATLSLAPGGGITESFGGTSSAAPVVSGVAAWILSVRPELTAAEVRDLLRDTARPDPRYQYDASGHNAMVGFGLLDLDALVEALYPPKKETVIAEDSDEVAWGCSQGFYAMPWWALLGLVALRRRYRT